MEKKNLCAIIALIGIGNFAQTGNVGINTPNPQETLHITGTFRLDNSTKGAGKVLVSDANGTGSWQTIGTGSGITLTTTGTSGPATLTGSTLNIPNYSYTLPIASSSILGGVKIGSGINVASDGTISVPASSNDWTILGNTGTTAASNLGSTVGSDNYVGTSDNVNLAIATAGITRAILDTNGTLRGGGTATSSFSWGNTNSIGTKNNAALGLNNTSTGQSSVALGDGNTASGDYSIAIGKNASATTSQTMSIGYEAPPIGGGTASPNSVAATYSAAIGYGNTVTGNKNFTFGLRNKLSGNNTGMNFTGGSYIIGADNDIASLNTLLFGFQNYTGGSSIIIGNQNGTSSARINAGITIGSSNQANTGGYILGTSNSITASPSTGAVIIGNNAVNNRAYSTVYSNDYHNFMSRVSAGTASNVGINVDTTTLTANQLQSDLTVKTQIRIVPQTPATGCIAETEGAIRYNATTKKHQGCNGSTWNDLY